ncbi:MAG: hypothetical protein UT61_C0051G0003 [Candidatus Woesebacteria bacterium GW2011_GWA1_39_8]|uniref:Uncharacterized protein n=1 Tax=Candidatus Woesebacteria bacterium GW2011_GWA1_39_8 TaxID=1618552 RepID=A0A0G0PTG9_9BACT|nr:MAG: hypothetical protein UT61_C0051G0003 [Candidatus Woesebacteria bacterium GW2011_GWA1_39_8]
MEKINWLKNEYNNLRGEVTERVKLLHLFILVAVLLNVAFLFMVFAMLIGGTSLYEIVLFLLFMPIVFALLTFNYQANQMTLEGAAGYISHQLREKLSAEDQKDFDQWDVFYGRYKKSFQLTSFLKVIPLLLPMTLPIWIYLLDSSYMSYPVNLLIYFDLVLFGLVIFNFRYKIGR